MIRRVTLLLLLAAGPATAELQWAPPAEIQKSPPATEEKAVRRPVAAFGEDHPDCLEWADGCIVCKRQDGDPACSMPGVACLPTEPECRTTRP